MEGKAIGERYCVQALPTMNSGGSTIGHQVFGMPIHEKRSGNRLRRARIAANVDAAAALDDVAHYLFPL